MKDRCTCLDTRGQQGTGECRNAQQGICTTCDGFIVADRNILNVDYWGLVEQYLEHCDNLDVILEGTTHKEVLKSQKFFQRRLRKTAQDLEEVSRRLNLDNSSAPFGLLQSNKELRHSIRKVIPEWRDQNEVCSIAEIVEYTK